MSGSGSSKKKYLAVGLGGAVVGAVGGGLLVAIITRAFPKLMATMKDMMSR